MNQTINDNRHEDGATKAPRESDGHHHAKVHHLVETAHRDLADYLGLHFRKKEQDGLQYAAADSCRGDVVEGHERHHLRLHFLVQGRDEPEPVHFERQPDADAQ